MKRMMMVLTCLSLSLIATTACTEPMSETAEYDVAQKTDEADPPEKATATPGDNAGTKVKAVLAENSHGSDMPPFSDPYSVDDTKDPNADDEGPAEETTPATDGEEEADEESTLRGVVNLNTASLEELMVLPGVGPATASRIEAYRKKRRFEEVGHLKRIKGIGEKTFEKLQEYLAIDGKTTLTD